MNKTILVFILFGGSIIQPILAQNKAGIEGLQKQIVHTYTVRPDSAKVYLHELLKYSTQLSDSLLARTYIKLGVTYGQAEQADSSRHYFKKGAGFARGNPRMLGDLYIDLGKTERNMADYDRAFRALEQAEAHYRDANYQIGIAKVHTEIGTIYNYMSEEGKAINKLKNAIRIFDSVGEDHYMFFAKHELANAYNNTGEYVFAIDLYEDILPKLKEKTSVYNYHIMLFGYAKCFLSMHKLDKAKEIYPEIINYFGNHNNLKLHSFALFKLAQVYEGLGQLEPAFSNYDKAFQGMVKIRSARLKQVAVGYLNFMIKAGKEKEALIVLRKIQQLSIDNKLAMNDRVEVNFLNKAIDVLEENNLYQEAFGLLKQATQLQDAIQMERNTIQIEEIQAKYQNEYRRIENQLLEEKNSLLSERNTAQKNVIILIVVLAVVMILVSLVIYRKQKQQAKLKEITLKNMEQSKKNLEEKMAMEATLYKERQEALEEKERELVGSSMKMAHLKNEVKSILETNGKTLNGLKPRLKSLLGKEKTWDYFMEKFVKVHPGFVEKIQESHPNLSKNDLDFCALILLRLSNKEIAVLLNISHESVITKKYRLRKKMRFSSQENSFEEYLNSLK